MPRSLLTVGVLVAVTSRILGEDPSTSDAAQFVPVQNCWESRETLYNAWRSLLAADSGTVTLLGFQGTIVQSIVGHRHSLRKSISPLNLYTGTVVHYKTSDNVVNFVQNSPSHFEGKVGMTGFIEGTLSDVVGPHLLTANLTDMVFDLKWDAENNFTLCLDRAGYINDLRSDENYHDWGQEVEALLAGAAVTALVSQIYSVAQNHPMWEVCPHRTNGPRNHQ